MSLRHFHVFFILSSASLMAFVLDFARRQSAAGRLPVGLALAAAAGLALALPYLAWFLRRKARP